MDRLILMGASGTGKSTMARDVPGDYFRVDSPTLRITEKFGGQQAILSHPSIRFDFQMEVAKETSRLILHAMRNHPRVVSDRGLCFLMYHVVYGDQVNRAVEIPEVSELIDLFRSPSAYKIRCYVLEPDLLVNKSAACQRRGDHYIQWDEVCKQHGALIGILSLLSIPFKLTRVR